MPVHYCQTDADVKRGDKAKLHIKDITLTTDPSRHYVQARVKVCYELSKTRSASLLKMQLQDDGGTIDVFAFGSVAEHLAACCRNDTVVMTGFLVEKPPQDSSSLHPCMLVLEERDTVAPTVWVLKPTPATSPGKRPVPPMTYTALKDVKMGDVVNVFGVVKFLKPPQKTRGPDYSMFLSLIDSSLHENEQKFKCVLFGKEEESLPNVNIGDVIRIHRLRVGQFGQELQGTYHPGQAWVLFPAASPDTPQASTLRFTLTPADKERVQRLLSWAKTISLEDTEPGGAVPQGGTDPVSTVQPTSSAAAPAARLGTIQLKDIIPNTYFNLICQVVATAMIEKDVCFLVRVWDGTKTCLQVAQVELGGVELKQDESLAAQAQGLVYDVCLYDDHIPRGTSIKPGDIIRLTNLRAARQKLIKEGTFQVLPTVELSLHRGSSFGRGVNIFPPNCEEAVALTTLLESCQPLSFSMPLSSQDSQQLGKTDSQQTPNAYLTQRENTNTSGRSNSDTQGTQNTESQSHISTNLRASQGPNSGNSADLSDVTNTNSPKRRLRSRHSNRNSEASDDPQCSKQSCPDASAGKKKNQQRQEVLEQERTSVESSTGTSSSRKRRVELAQSSHKPTIRKQQCQEQPQKEAECQVVAATRGTGPGSSQSPPQQNDRLRTDLQQVQGQQQGSEDSPAPAGLCVGSGEKGKEVHPRCMLDTATVMLEPRPHLPFTALHEVLHHSVPYKFKVQARVSSYTPCPAFPSSLLHLRCPRCHYTSPLRWTEEDSTRGSQGCSEDPSMNPRWQRAGGERGRVAGTAQETPEHHAAPSKLCPQCAKLDCPQEMHWVMALKMCLHDGDSSLWTLLCKDEAVKFFNGISPEEMQANARAGEAVQEYLDKICPPDTPLAARPIVECCLFSYHTRNGKTAFQIFDTVAV